MSALKVGRVQETCRTGPKLESLSAASWQSCAVFAHQKLGLACSSITTALEDDEKMQCATSSGCFRSNRFGRCASGGSQGFPRGDFPHRGAKAELFNFDHFE